MAATAEKQTGELKEPVAEKGSCKCPSCGEEAKYDVAPNPGLQFGGPGPGAAEVEPPEGEEEGPAYDASNPPWAITISGSGTWLMVRCKRGHNTLWPASNIEELSEPEDEEAIPPLPGGTGFAPPWKAWMAEHGGEREGKPGEKKGGKEGGKEKPAPEKPGGSPGQPGTPHQPGQPHQPQPTPKR